jgi:hypothetical protein
VHVHADRDRGVAAREPARPHDDVVQALGAHAAQLGRDRRRVDAGGGEQIRAREREAPVAIVVGGAAGERLDEPLGERHEASAGLGACGQRKAHDYAAMASTPTGTPLATMS